MARLNGLLWCVALGVGAGALLVGCSGGGERAEAESRGPEAAEPAGDVRTDGNADVEVGEGEDRTARLLSLMEQAQRNSEIDLDLGGDGEERWEGAREWEGARSTAGMQARPAARTEARAVERPAMQPVKVREAPAEAEEAPIVEVAETRAERMERLSGELAGVLRAEFDGADLVLGPALEAHALETIRVGTLQSHFPELVKGTSWRGLSGPEREFLDAWRAMQDGVRTDAEMGDVGAMAGRVSAAAEGMRGLRGLAVTNAALATRVENYGVYTEIDRRGDGNVYRFVAGQRHRVVVYTEVENFGRRSDVRSGVDGYAVELTHELSLSHLGSDGGDLVAWSMPEQRVDYFSRRPVRDFFLTSVIELPETLSVDRYALKVRVRDRVTGKEAEGVIRIDMVAHASALEDRR